MVNSGIVKWCSTKQHSNYSFISAPASSTNVSGDHNMTEGSNQQLFCEASGKPAPNITWVRVLWGGSESEVLHRGPTWHFLNINRAKAGTYRCTAYNGAGDPVRHTLTVNVLCKYYKISSLKYHQWYGLVVFRVLCIMSGYSTNTPGETVENLSSEIRSSLQMIVTKYFRIPSCIGNICVYPI